MIDIKAFIEGNQIDLSEQFSTFITYKIDDIKNFGSRDTSVSKTIILPGTKRNNKVLGNIFMPGSSNLYSSVIANVNENFNPSVSAKCLIFQNNIQVFKGVIKLLEVITTGAAIEYEAAVYGELGGLIFKLGAKKLEELDFSAYDQSYTLANIRTSWVLRGSGMCMPLIDYGGYSSNKHDWDYKTFRPAFFVKEYIDKIFEGAGFTFDSDLFESDRFLGLIVPHNAKFLTGKSSNFMSGNPEYKVYNSSGSRILLSLTSSNLGSFSFSAGNTRMTNTGAAITADINFSLTGLWNSSGSATIKILKNGVEIASSYLGIGGAFRYFTNTFSAGVVSIATSDYIEFVIDITPSSSYVLTTSVGYLSVASDKPVLVNINLGETIKANDCIPKNIRQVDFFSSIVKLFNLYVTDDKVVANKLNIIPFVDYYSGEIIDWTSKVNRAAPIRQKPMGELNSRYYEFNYASDSDYYNEMYSKRYNKSYGSYVFDSSYEHSNDSSKLEIIFAGTPLVGYAGEDKVYSTILKISNNVEDKTDSKIRILQTKVITDVTPYNILDGATVLGSNSYYGYAGHLDDPDAPTNDLNFGVPEELFFSLVTGTLNVNQFNVYYSSYMAEITNKDSKLLVCNLFLNEMDIDSLDMSKFVYIDGVLYRVNKIIDYNTTKRAECQAELLKVIKTEY